MTSVPVPAAEPGPARLVLTLGVAGMISGLLLVTAYETTLPAIEHNRREALRAAVFRVVPGATQMQVLVWRDGSLREAAAGEALEGATIYAAYGPDRAFLGYAIPHAGAGFQDTIALIYGYDPVRRRVIGMQVLESRETPGLGDKIYKDARFVAEFDDLAVSPPIEAVKRGTGAAPHQVDAITGATISSKAVVRILNAAHAAWLARLPEQPPALPEEGGR